MRLLRHSSTRPVSVLAFGAGRLAAGSAGGYEVWDLAGGEVRRFPLTGTSTPQQPLVVDPLGRWIYVKDAKHGPRLLPLDVAEPGPPPGHPEDGFGVLTASPDGRRVVMSRSWPGTTARLECWEVAALWRSVDWRAVWAYSDGEPCEAAPIFSEGRGWWPLSVAYSPDGRRVGVLESRRQRRGYAMHLVVRDADTGAQSSELDAGPIDYHARIHFLSDSRRMAIVAPRSVSLWDPARGERLALMMPRGAMLRALAVHPSGRFLVALGRSLVSILHAGTLTEIRAYRWRIREMHCLALSDDGTLGAVGGVGGQVALWDVED